VKTPDVIRRRIVIDFGSRYVYAALTDANGKIIDEEVWSEPYPLTAAEVTEESREAWQCVYQHFLDSMVFPSASDAGESDMTEEDPDDPPQD
jgi:hypothetical protein